MGRIYFYWNDSYAVAIHGFLGEYPRLNISYHVFTPYEIRGLRKTKVFLLPQNAAERKYADALQKEFNKYGVVSLVMNPHQQNGDK